MTWYQDVTLDLRGLHLHLRSDKRFHAGYTPDAQPQRAGILRHVEREPQEGAAFALVFNPCDYGRRRYVRGVMKGVAFGVLGHTCDATFESDAEFLLFRLLSSAQTD
jgi:hypothetical protein